MACDMVEGADTTQEIAFVELGLRQEQPRIAHLVVELLLL